MNPFTQIVPEVNTMAQNDLGTELLKNQCWLMLHMCRIYLLKHNIPNDICEHIASYNWNVTDLIDGLHDAKYMFMKLFTRLGSI